MESSHLATLQIPVIKQAIEADTYFPKIKTAPLISLGVICDYGCTIILDMQDMIVQKNGQEIIKGTRNKQTGMWEVPL